MPVYVYTDIIPERNAVHVKMYVEWFEDDEMCGLCSVPLTRVCECENAPDVRFDDCPCNIMVCWNENCENCEPVPED
jgi:hypothetical protein